MKHDLKLHKQSNIYILVHLISFFVDPLIVSLAQDIFLSLNEACPEPVQQRLLPTLVSVLQAEADKVPMGLPSVS